MSMSSDLPAPSLIGVSSRAVARLIDLARPDRVSILIFHRVHRSSDPIFPGEVDATRFDAMLAMLARAFRVLTLGEAARRIREGTLPARALAITFDDGYADNADVALPILQRHGLRATFFVATGFLDGGRMWNDTVIEAIRLTKLERVDLTFLGLAPMSTTSLDERRSAIAAVLPRLKYMTLDEREQSLTQLLVATGHPSLPTDLMMRSDQVVALHQAGMEIGGHTVRHPILTRCAPAQARDEIAAGREHLQRLIDAPVDVFAYPNGSPGVDYDRSHRDLVESLGFTAAVNTAVGTAGRASDPFQLPRYNPWHRSVGPWMAQLLAMRWKGCHERQRLAV